MSSIGPTKEELRDYFQNNRQYFDELAKYYRESDPEFYKANIAPFYSNPLLAAGTGKSSKGCLTITLSIAILIIGLVAGLVFFILQQDESEDKQITPQIQKEERKVITPDSVKAIPDNPDKRKKKKK